MKVLLLAPFVFLLFGYSCRKEVSLPEPVAVVQLQVSPDTTSAIAFDKEIVPILKSHCSPCHFTGGKMYEKMPFDNPKTITSHVEGVLKRFKDPERAKIKSYLEQGAGI